jgi:hypothetical protein
MKLISLAAAVLGIIGLAIGGVFIGVSQHEHSFITSQLREQGITLGLTKDQIANGEFVDNSAEAQTAAKMLSEHLKSIAPTYAALTAQNPSGKYDPTNMNDLTYSQGLNLMNSMNLVVLGYGVDQAIMGTGAGFLVVGLGLGATGIITYRVVSNKERTIKTQGS